MQKNESKSNNAIIVMQNVGIRYGQGPEVLSDISLSLPRGSFHFLTGRSGAGKTSLLSMMYLAQKPSRGIVQVFGRNINFTNRDSLSLLRRKIGVVFQDFRLLEHLSAFDNVALPLRICGMNEREVKKRVTELLQWVELDRNMYAKTSTLSGGEKQRTAIARAVINRPDLLLADEPTGNVDNDIAPKLMKLFVDEESIVFYFSDHGLDIYQSNADYFGHAISGVNEHFGLQIPFVVFTSSLFQIHYPQLMQRIKGSLNRTYNTEDMIYTVMDVLGVTLSDNTEVSSYSLFR